MLSVIEGQLGHRRARAPACRTRPRRPAQTSTTPGSPSSCSWCSAAPRGCTARRADARQHFEAAVALAEARRDTTLRVVALTELGSLLVDSGDAAAALAATRQAVAAAAGARRCRPGQHVHAGLGLVVALARAAGQRPGRAGAPRAGHQLPRHARRRGQPQRRGPAPQLVQQGAGAPPPDPRLAGRRPPPPAAPARAIWPT